MATSSPRHRPHTLQGRRDLVRIRSCSGGIACTAALRETDRAVHALIGSPQCADKVRRHRHTVRFVPSRASARARVRAADRQEERGAINAVALYDGVGESHAGLPRRSPHRREQVLRQRCPPRRLSVKTTSQAGWTREGRGRDAAGAHHLAAPRTRRAPRATGARLAPAPHRSFAGPGPASCLQKFWSQAVTLRDRDSETRTKS